MDAELHPLLTPLVLLELGKPATWVLLPWSHGLGGVKFHATISKNMEKLEQIQHQVQVYWSTRLALNISAIPVL